MRRPPHSSPRQPLPHPHRHRRVRSAGEPKPEISTQSMLPTRTELRGSAARPVSSRSRGGLWTAGENATNTIAATERSSPPRGRRGKKRGRLGGLTSGVLKCAPKTIDTYFSTYRGRRQSPFSAILDPLPSIRCSTSSRGISSCPFSGTGSTLWLWLPRIQKPSDNSDIS